MTEPTMRDVLSQQPVVGNEMFPIYDRLVGLVERWDKYAVPDHCCHRLCAKELAAILYGPEGKP